MKFKTIYNYKQKDGVKNTSPSMTQQQFKAECDINRIMDRYLRTGVLSDPLSQRKPGTYGDFSELGDYMENMNKVVEAQNMFEALPARIRERFANNPANMIEFVMDSSNRDEAVKLGLLQIKEQIKDTVTPAGVSSQESKEESTQIPT